MSVGPRQEFFNAARLASEVAHALTEEFAASYCRVRQRADFPIELLAELAARMLSEIVPSLLARAWDVVDEELGLAPLSG
jgi:hypothetical protein